MIHWDDLGIIFPYSLLAARKYISEHDAATRKKEQITSSMLGLGFRVSLQTSSDQACLK